MTERVSITPFDPTIYTRVPTLSFAALISLAQDLCSTAPRDLGPNASRCRDRLMTALAQAQEMLARDAGGGLESVDVDTDACWTALRQRCEAFATLPEDASPDVARAKELVQILFADGTSFLQLPYTEQGAEMRMILQRIERDSLRADLERIAGKIFVDAVYSVQLRYQGMIDTILARAEAQQHLTEHAKGLTQRIQSYAVAVLGAADLDDPANVSWARIALAPIALARHESA